MPEHLSPLFYTPIYQELSEAQRLRYNQLHASYVLEQTIFFESSMARHIVTRLAETSLPEGWSSGLRAFVEEEHKHSQMFRELNQKCLPAHYAQSDYHFIRIGRATAGLLGAWVKRPGWFPLFLWLLLLEEERSLQYSKEFVKAAWQLEPSFVAVQRAHMADEVGHIGWDEKLLDWIWPRTPPWQRRMNARLFIWLVGEYFNTPKRGGLQVIRELVTEFPSLQSRRAQMEQQIQSLAQNADYHRSLYSREITPRAFRRFDDWEEFRGIGEALLGYEPTR